LADRVFVDRWIVATEFRSRPLNFFPKLLAAVIHHGLASPDKFGDNRERWVDMPVSGKVEEGQFCHVWNVGETNSVGVESLPLR
jgi:hypothetical protein